MKRRTHLACRRNWHASLDGVDGEVRDGYSWRADVTASVALTAVAADGSETGPASRLAVSDIEVYT